MRNHYILFIWLLFPGIWSVKSQQPVQMSIDFSKQGITVSPMLYGIFFEDINFAADGGLYAELIRNRSFEESVNYWKMIQGNGSKGSMTIETRNLLNTAQKYCLRLTADTIKPDGFIGIQNTGFWGINVIDKTEYNLSFYAKSVEGFTGVITVSLVNSNGTIQYAYQRIAGLSTNWKKYTCKLIASVNDPAAKFSLSINAAGTVWLDVVSLFPQTFNNRPNGLRKDLAQKLEDLRPAFMRFPGGCFVEGGTMVQAFRWKQTIGPIEERPGHQNFWGYRTSDGMGYHEFLQLCEDIGAEPLYVCNVGMSHNEMVSMANLNPWVQDALNAIEYANGDTSTTWGNKRKVNGHPESFNMKYIEIGNENWVEPYTSHYNMFYDSIKTYYPEMITISNTSWTSLKHIDVYDDHYYSSPEWFAQNSNKYDKTSRTGPKVYVGEYAVTSSGAGNGNLRDAVGEASFMTGLERNSDVVIMSSYAPLLGNLNQRQWNPDAIYFNSSGSYGTPSYYAQKMFANNTGNKTIPMQDMFNIASDTDYNGAIGVATWVTQCQYDSITVQSGDSVIINENFDNNASGWKVRGGTWAVNGGVYEQTSLNTDCRSTLGNITLPAYTVHLKARKNSGNEGFLIIFGYADDNNYYWWNIGGWNNTLSAIEHSSGGSKGTITSVSYSVTSNKWYDIRVEVNKDSAKCYLDNVLMHDIVVGSKFLYSSCTVDTVNQDIFLKVVNFSDSNKAAGIQMKNLPKNIMLEGSVQTMTYATPSSENSILAPEKIAPSILNFSSADTGFQYTFPRNSITIFHLYPQSPLLHLTNETFTIRENSGIGFSAGMLNASGGSKFMYSILKSSLKGAFEINDTTGEVSVKDSSLLNYEVTPSVSLNITAKDILNESIPAVRGTCIINLSDVNEKPMLISSNYYAFANDTTGAPIGKIFLTDEDRGQSYSYSMKAQSEVNLLNIDNATGELTLGNSNDLSSLIAKTITFTVEVSDNGSPSLSDEKEFTLEVMAIPVLVAVNYPALKNNLEVYPNPAGNKITIIIPDLKVNLVINMIDSKGIIVCSKKVSSGHTIIETSNLSNGLYYIQVIADGRVVAIQNVVILK
jgi:alpha-L-arabinofuranosidase